MLSLERMIDSSKYLPVFGVLIVLAIALGVIISKRQNRAKATAIQKRPYPPPADIYLGLRKQILEASRTKIGLAAPSAPTEPWGVVMDWGVTNGTATVVALADGSASIYLSSGGGSIGGQSEEKLRNAAQTAVRTSAQFLARAHSTTTYPLPQQGEVTFYFLTDEGVFTTTASDAKLRTREDALYPLGNAMQEIVTQYRLLQTKPSP